jgi:hypothetical protein
VHVNTNEYDTQGNNTHFMFRGDLGTWDYYYTFDDHGNKLTAKRVNEAGDTTEVNTYVYDADGHMLENTYSVANKPEYSVKFRYDEELLMKKESFNSKGKLVRTERYFYDTMGRIQKEIHDDIERGEQITYTYSFSFY